MQIDKKNIKGGLTTLQVIALWLLVGIGLYLATGWSLRQNDDINVYMPKDSLNEGFVGKTNALLALLVDTTRLEYVDEKGAIDLHTLNKKYKALEFALVNTGTHDVTRGEELRLVGIKADSIKDEKFRRFYYNSNIPFLLKKQRNNLNDNIFQIQLQIDKNAKKVTKKDQTCCIPFCISSIKIDASMFSVSMNKKMWEGKIMCNYNNLFSEKEFIYLTCNNFVLPLRIGKKLFDEDDEMANGNFSNIYINSHTDDVYYEKEGEPIDYYKYYKFT